MLKQTQLGEEKGDVQDEDIVYRGIFLPVSTAEGLSPNDLFFCESLLLWLELSYQIAGFFC